MKRSILFVLLLAVCVTVAASNSQAQTGAVKIDTVMNTQYTDNRIQDGVSPRIVLRYINNYGVKLDIANGWQISTPDGAQWDSVTMDSAGPVVSGENSFIRRFPTAFGLQSGSYGGVCCGDGTNPDTVGLIGAGNPTNVNQQMPIGFNDTVFAIIVHLDPAVDNHGKHICVDSAFWGTGGTWLWVGTFPTQFEPEWQGLAGQTHTPGQGYCFLIADPNVDVEEANGSGLPTTFSVGQNYPNPFNPNTAIDFDVPRKSHVSLTVYNVLGQKVSTLVDKEMAAGSYKANWDGKSDAGAQLSSGVYFYKFEAGSYVETKKMLMLK